MPLLFLLRHHLKLEMEDTHPLTLLHSRIQWLHPLELHPQHPWSFLFVGLFQASYPQGSGTLLSHTCDI